MKGIWFSIRSAIIRFFDNRFNGSIEPFDAARNEIEFLRMELEKERNRNNQLIEMLGANRMEYQQVVTGETTNFQPITTGGFTSWSQKQRQLEQKQRNRAIELAEEARKKLALERARNKTTEELEQELLANE